MHSLNCTAKLLLRIALNRPHGGRLRAATKTILNAKTFSLKLVGAN